MSIKVIHNPYSARWTSQSRLPELIKALDNAGLKYELTTTKGPHHATEIAEQAVVDGFETIIAAGGDGTLGEVVQGIMKGAGDGPIPKFGVMPLGTANDLVFNLGLPNNLDEMAGIIAKGNTRQIDVCKVNDRFFLNNAGMGLEPYITVQSQKIHFLKGVMRYLLATVIGIFHDPSWEIHLEWDQGEYSGPVTLVSIGNGARTGGFFMTPHADPFDGMLTFSFGFIPGRLRKLSILPKAFKADEGNLTEHPQIHEINTSRLKITTTPSPAHSDGELFSLGLTALEYTILPGKLPFLIDPSSDA